MWINSVSHHSQLSSVSDRSPTETKRSSVILLSLQKAIFTVQEASVCLITWNLTNVWIWTCHIRLPSLSNTSRVLQTLVLFPSAESAVQPEKCEVSWFSAGFERFCHSRRKPAADLISQQQARDFVIEWRNVLPLAKQPQQNLCRDFRIQLWRLYSCSYPSDRVEVRTAAQFWIRQRSSWRFCSLCRQTNSHRFCPHGSGGQSLTDVFFSVAASWATAGEMWQFHILGFSKEVPDFSLSEPGSKKGKDVIMSKEGLS